MPIVQKILAHDRHLEVLERPPGEANINDYVARNLEIRQALDVTNSAIDLEVVGQIHRRTQTELVVRVPALIKFARGVPAARIAMELILKERIACLETPRVGDLPARGKLNAVGFAVKLVACGSRHG